MFLDFLNPGLKQQGGQPKEKAPRFTEADFLPYACHLDPYTLLTKNGELMQTLRIAADAQGREYESGLESTPLREILRPALVGHASQAISIWLHTLRRRIPIDHSAQFGEHSAKMLHDAWDKAHPWKYSYRNEIYVTILHRGQIASLFNMEDAKKGILPTRHRNFRAAYLEEAKAQLTEAVTSIAHILAPHFFAERLGITEFEGRMYSEPLEFLHYLLNLEHAPVAVPEMDFSRALATHDITFGFDTVESKSTAGKRRFGAMLMLKGCPDLPTHALDRCLQLPQEMIITQTITFTPPTKALEKQEEIRDVLETSPDEVVLHAAGLADILAADEDAPADFAEQHTSIFVISDQYRALDEAVGTVQQSFGTLGLITVREDIMLEEAFWAQLPGNYAFIRRTATIPSARMAGFARLNHFPCGEGKSPWGGPVAVLPTTLGTPYALHFHVGQNAHTAVLDFNSLPDTFGPTLVNFLASQSRQFGGRLIMLDRNFSARPMVQALGGTYFQPTGERNDAPVNVLANPLQLPDTPRNRAFLAAWLSHFVPESAMSHDTLRPALEEIVAAQFALPPEQRNVRSAVEAFLSTHPALIGALTMPDAALFAPGADTIDFSHAVTGIELGEVAHRSGQALPYFSYLLHRIIQTLDGTPTVIVLHEAWDFLDNDFFSSRIGSLLDMLSQNNAMLLVTSRHLADHAESHITHELMPKLANTFFIPDDIATDYLPKATGLTPTQEGMLSALERQKGEFLIRHGLETLACSLPTKGLEDFLHVLAGDSMALRLAQLRQRY